MRGSKLQKAFGGVDWGVATASGLAAPPTGSSGLELSGLARRWSLDMAALLGEQPASRQMVAGWPHLQPEGPGRWDRAALDRCDRGLDRLLEQGIRPGLTLLHIDLPGWVDASGGWLERDTALRFADFAAGMGERFGDRVVRWMTVSDLLVHAVADYIAGMLPTGRGVGMRGLEALHHVLLGAGLATRALRRAGATGEVGAAATLMGAYAASDEISDRIALERLECWAHRIFLDPVLLGSHMVTEDGRSPVEDTGCVRPGDLEAIAEPVDVFGMIWHQPSRVAAPENLSRLLPARECFTALNDVNGLFSHLGFALVPMAEVETTAYGWPIVPEALADAVAALHELYGEELPPLRIIDNGMWDLEPGAASEEERERSRTAFTAQLGWLSHVMAEGVRISGYDYWSLMDNAAWKLCYSRHYGMAMDDRQHPPQPAIPRDWVHQEGLGGTAGSRGWTGERVLHAV